MNIHELAIGPFSYGIAFMTGLLGSAHCIGMCGALVSGNFIRLGREAHGPLPYLSYQLARIGVYTLIGIAAASAGHALISMGFIGAAQGILQLVVGLAVVIIGLEIGGFTPWRLRTPGLSVAIMGHWLRNITRKGPVAGALIGGIMNGFIPCPLSFAMAIKAATAPSPLEGALLMLIFGLGTVPAMLFVSVAFGLLGGQARVVLLRAAALLVVVMGLGTVWQGFSYFSVMRGLVY
ncbi:MAG: sulfite exporter TauE/SafE family protein [Gammaproteobacteria bacterium]|nr:sulfite exporter TauE/SafE family protein [Gammaproteobacteria bacterium]NNJ85225.1 sulfite exporter TauE/SafE family protein [Gammaproteobacteria bacterium]